MAADTVKRLKPCLPAPTRPTGRWSDKQLRLPEARKGGSSTVRKSNKEPAGQRGPRELIRSRVYSGGLGHFLNYLIVVSDYLDPFGTFSMSPLDPTRPI